VSSMANQGLELLGISRDQIQEIFEQALKDFKSAKTRIIYIDASYLYTFHLDDFDYIRKLCLLNRTNVLHVREWHRLLERWCNDQTVRMYDNGSIIKPMSIVRSLDRVVNEGMEILAGIVTGGTGSGIFEYRTIGDGPISATSPSDKALSNEIDRINVNTTPEGGSLSRDGTTIISVGNHAKTVPTPANNLFTECGMHNTDSALTDDMFDHSKFATGVPHTQNADAPGSTTVVYMCSG
jgi:hypothetical protein